VNYDAGPTSGPLVLSFPLQTDAGGKVVTQTYWIGIHNNQDGTANPPTTSNYYFVDHFIGSDQPVGAYEYGQPEREVSGAHTNDTAGAAEVLKSPAGVTGGFYADGNLDGTGDVDWYTMTVPATATTAHFACQAGRTGSGASGFSANLFSNAGGTAMLAQFSDEAVPATTDLDTTAALPAGTRTVTLQVMDHYQDPNNGSYYRCSIEFR